MKDWNFGIPPDDLHLYEKLIQERTKKRMNKVILMGRLTRDPNVRYTQQNSSQESMCVATNSANGAATTANNAASTASAAAKACQGIVDGLNTMVDTVTKKSCVLTVEDGILTIREA